MHNHLTENEAAHAKAVREMFAGIAGRYDLLNHVLSLNIDKRWRRLVADELREILDRDLCGNARAMGARLRSGLERTRDRTGIIGDIRGKGLFLGIEFVKDRATKERFPADPPIGTLIGRRALDNGLLTRFDPQWLALGPPLVVTATDIDAILQILDHSIDEILQEVR